MLQKNFLILVSGILKNDKGNVLLLLRSDKNSSYRKCWQLPEGKIEFGEEPEEALQREIKEEAGLSPMRSKLMFVTTAKMTAKGEDYHVVRIVYDVECGDNRVITLSQDHDDFCWYDPYTAIPLGKEIAGLEEILEKLKR